MRILDFVTDPPTVRAVLPAPPRAARTGLRPYAGARSSQAELALTSHPPSTSPTPAHSGSPLRSVRTGLAPVGRVAGEAPEHDGAGYLTWLSRGATSHTRPWKLLPPSGAPRPASWRAPSPCPRGRLAHRLSRQHSPLPHADAPVHPHANGASGASLLAPSRSPPYLAFRVTGWLFADFRKRE